MLARAADGPDFRPSASLRQASAPRTRSGSRVPAAPAVATVAHLSHCARPLCSDGLRLLGLQPRGGAFSPPKKRGTERSATDPATAGCDRRDGWCHCAALRVYLRLCPASQPARPICCDQDAMYALRHRTSSSRRTSDARFEGQRGFTARFNQASSHARRARRPDASERRGSSSSQMQTFLLRIGLGEGSGCATDVSAVQSQEGHVLRHFFWPSRWLPRWSNTAPRVRCRGIYHVCSKGTPPTRAAIREPMRRTLSSAADEFSDDLEMQT